MRHRKRELRQLQFSVRLDGDLPIIFAKNEVNTLIRTALCERDTVTEPRVELRDEPLELPSRHCANMAVLKQVVTLPQVADAALFELLGYSDFAVLRSLEKQSSVVLP